MSLFAQDLPLPEFRAAPQAYYAGDSLLKPSVVIKAPPVTGNVQVPRESVDQEVEEPLSVAMQKKIQQMERKIVVAQIERRIRQQAIAGQSSELKQVILVSDDVADRLHQQPQPPAQSLGQVTLLGLEAHTHNANPSLVQGFIGEPVTPESERALLKKVEAQLNAEQPKRRLNASVAGWWPESGVLAVRVGPQS